MDNLLAEYPVVIDQPVAWGEMDAFQHVNNIVYFRYFESARVVYVQKLKYMDYMKETGYGPILASINCKYKFPITYPDDLLVGVRTLVMKEDRMIVKHCLVSKRHEKVAAEGEALIVSFNYHENKKAPFPKKIRDAILDLERSFGNQVIEE